MLLLSKKFSLYQYFDSQKLLKRFKYEETIWSVVSLCIHP
jgi:hypothetical protein